MQSKGIIKVFAILLVIVCFYQLTFTFVTNNVENNALAYASSRNAGTPDSMKIESAKRFKQDFLDSVSNKTVYNLGFKKWTYQQCKEQQLALGLDLQGGMSVVLQVSLEDLIRNMSGKSTDPAFVAALEEASKAQAKSNKDLVTLFGDIYQQKNAGAKLSSIFATAENKGKIDIDFTNAQVIEVIKKEASEAVARSYSIITSRIDKFGTSAANISLDNATGRIVVEMPGAQNPRRVRKVLQATAQLEFWETYTLNDIYPSFAAINTALLPYVIKEEANKSEGSAGDMFAKNNKNDTTKVVADAKPEADTTKKINALNNATNDSNKNSLLSDDTSAGGGEDTSREAIRKKNPLFAKLQMPTGEDADYNKQVAKGPMMGYASAKDTATIISYFKIPQIKAMLRNDVKFLWGAKSVEEGSNVFALYAIKKRVSSDEAPIDGSVIVDAKQDYDQQGQPDITMQMNTQGAKEWKKMTANNVGRSVAVVLDNQVYSAPNVNQEIAGGNTQIMGNFTIDEAQDLAAILKAGKLPAPAKIVEEEQVGPTLGNESIKAGLLSLLIGFLLVIFLMIIYYSTSGWVADAVLLLNLLFIIGFLASIGTALTLAGMAGILLTIAIAVDANILVFERVKEELASGKSLKVALADGYENALSSILDANITNLITGAVMLYFGLGPVKGFAVVLVAGIISSLFTAILISRIIFEWLLSRGTEIKFSTPLSKNLFKGINFDFVGRRRIGYIVSSTVIVVGILSMIFKGFDYSVDFIGGRTYTVRFSEDVSTNEVRQALTASFGDEAPIVKTFGANNQVRIITSHKINDTGLEVDSLMEHKLYDGLKSRLGGADFNTFINKNLMSSQKVGPTIADDIKSSSIIAALVSILLIFLYIVIRFRKWQYGLGAIIATIHDVMFVLALFSLLSGVMPFSLEVDQTFIAAILTIIGYSLNDTVVVFDRIREYLGIRKNQTMEVVINSAINDTLSRTLMTSLVTFLVVFVLFLFGGEVIRGFSFAMLLGVVVGTYSSIFIATPVVIDLDKDSQKVLK